MGCHTEEVGLIKPRRGIPSIAETSPATRSRIVSRDRYPHATPYVARTYRGQARWRDRRASSPGVRASDRSEIGREPSPWLQMPIQELCVTNSSVAIAVRRIDSTGRHGDRAQGAIRPSRCPGDQPVQAGMTVVDPPRRTARGGPEQLLRTLAD